LFSQKKQVSSFQNIEPERYDTIEHVTNLQLGKW
jgi:hypothetical protein